MRADNCCGRTTRKASTVRRSASAFPRWMRTTAISIRPTRRRPSRSSSGPGALVYAGNHLGSVSETLALNGKAVTHSAYGPYGETQTKGRADYRSDFRYAGMQYHAASGMYLTQFRAYDPNTRRWGSRDPMGEDGGINLYAYVGGDPISKVDPRGLDNPGMGPYGPAWSTSPSPDYWDRVMTNYQQTMCVMRHVPGLNPITMATAPAVAPLIGGLTWGEALAYAGTDLAANAYLAAAMTSVATGILMNGAFSTGVLIGSMISLSVINP
jgi:RHS repeat-associated protein